MSYAYATEPSSASHVAPEAKASPVTTDHNAKVIPALHRAQFTPTQAAVIDRHNAFRARVNDEAAKLAARKAAEKAAREAAELAALAKPKPAIDIIFEQVKAEKPAIFDRPLTSDIQQIVAEHFGMTRDDLMCTRRLAHIVRPRQIAMFLAYEMTGRSYPYLGRRFFRDHSTVFSAVRRIKTLCAEDSQLDKEVAAIRSKILDRLKPST